MGTKNQKRDREEVDGTVISAKKRAEIAIDDFEDFCDAVSTDDCHTMLMAGSVKARTFTSYSTQIRYALKLLNATSEKNIEQLGAKKVEQFFLKTAHAFQMMTKAAEAISKAAFIKIIAFKSDRGLGGNMILRCALLKAQQMVGAELWAGERLYRDMAIVADRRAKNLNPSPLRPTGAITEEMLEQLIQWIEEDSQQIPYKQLLSQFWRTEFYGCFRISELQKLKVSHVIREGGVWLEDPKHKRQLSLAPDNLKKQLDKWGGGQIAQDIIEEMCHAKQQDDFVFGTLWSVETLNKIIQKGSAALGWREDLRYGTHGFRHGGIYYMVETEEMEVPSEEIQKALDMNESMILHYARTNEDRVGEQIGAKERREGGGDMYLRLADRETTFDPLRSTIIDTVRGDRKKEVSGSTVKPNTQKQGGRKTALILKKPEAYIDYPSMLTEEQSRAFLRSNMDIVEFMKVYCIEVL